MYVSRLREALPRVLDQVRESAERSGRTGDAVTLVAVTKGHPVDAVEAALEVGLRDIGENRVPELAAKVAALGKETARWHMIGNVQRRKAPQLVGLCQLVHSVDSIRLAERFHNAVSPDDAPWPILIQVNTSGEPSKNGFVPEETQEGDSPHSGARSVRGPRPHDDGSVHGPRARSARRLQGSPRDP